MEQESQQHVTKALYRASYRPSRNITRERKVTGFFTGLKAWVAAEKRAIQVIFQVGSGM